MNERLDGIIFRHQSRTPIAGLHCTFSDEERRVIHGWLQQERRARMPEEETWQTMLTNKEPFFRGAFADMIQGKEGRLMMDCASPILPGEKIQALFPNLKDQGIRFVFSALQRAQINIFPGSVPLLIDRSRPAFIWMVQTKNEDCISVKPATSEYIAAALLRTWKDQRTLMKLARERLCDILSKCLTA